MRRRRKQRRKRRKIPGVGKYLLGGEKWRKDEKKEKSKKRRRKLRKILGVEKYLFWRRRKIFDQQR